MLRLWRLARQSIALRGSYLHPLWPPIGQERRLLKVPRHTVVAIATALLCMAVHSRQRGDRSKVRQDAASDEQKPHVFFAPYAEARPLAYKLCNLKELRLQLFCDSRPTYGRLCLNQSTTNTLGAPQEWRQASKSLAQTFPTPLPYRCRQNVSARWISQKIIGQPLKAGPPWPR